MYTEYINKFNQALSGMKFFKERGALEIDSHEDGIEMLVDAFIKVRTSGKKLFFIGNGGSSAIASHMTVDFMKNGGMKTCSLLDHSVLTCIGNDYGYEQIFSYPLKLLAEEADLLIAISSSGNSKNIVNAIITAKEKGMKTITLSGFEANNKIKTLSDYSVYVPIEHYGIVESIHNLILQQIVDILLEKDNS